MSYGPSRPVRCMMVPMAAWYRPSLPTETPGLFAGMSGDPRAVNGHSAPERRDGGFISQANPPRVGKTAAVLDLGSARILVADRDVMCTRVIASVLQQSGYDAVVVSDGQAVLDALEGHAIDVVLLDLGSPTRAASHSCGASIATAATPTCRSWS